MVVQDGNLVKKELPAQTRRRFEQAGITDPLICEILEEQLREVET
jgi:hypothetical protein